MKKGFSLISLFLIIILIFSTCIVVNAAPSHKDVPSTMYFSASGGKIEKGKDITVSVTVQLGEPMSFFTGKITYNSALLKHKSGGENKGGYVNFVIDDYGATSVTISATFTAIATGNNTFSYSGSAANEAATDYLDSAQSARLEITEPQMSSSTPTTPSTPSTPTPSKNANLASLKVSGATLSPKFNSNTTSYTATVPFDTDKVTISAGAADAGATFTGAGTINLKVGDNKRTITVTAASGAKKSYTLVIKRLAEDQGEPEVPVETVDPLLISAEGVSRKIMQDISSMGVPESFTATTVEVNDVQVGALTELGGRYTLLYTTLEDGSDAALYYKDDAGEYRRLRYIEVNGKFYIIADTPNGVAPDGWYRDSMNISGGSVAAYRSENPELKDFYVLYCYADAAYGFYRYDSLKTTIQRAPDFNLDIPVSNDPVVLEDKESIFKRFGNMNPVGKTIIILIGLAIVCIAALAVLLIMRLIKNNIKEEDDGLFSDDDSQEDLVEQTNPSEFDFIVEDAEEVEESEESDKDW